MKTIKLSHLANIKITTQNCDEIIAESLELMNQASMLKARSMQIKRGIAHRREQERKLGAIK